MAYKRSIYLINPKFQIRISAYVCIFMLLATIIYPITVYDLLGSLNEVFMKIDPSKATNLAQNKKDIFILLLGWQIAITFLVFIIFIFITHKIAGPIFKLQKHLEQISNGTDPGPLFFRKGDHFRETADFVNDAFDHLKETRAQDFMYLSEVNSYLKNIAVALPEDKKVVINEITQKLSEIQNRFDND